MTTQYARNVLKIVVAQICQTIGWHSINSTPLEFIVDLMQEYIFQLAKISQQYAQVLGRCDANLDDLGLAFRHMNIDLHELAEYVRNVDSVPCIISVPKLPIHRESHLNFLKPGSREVVTRPVHVHEHLPAMYPSTEEEYVSETKQTETASASTVNDLTTSEEDSMDISNTVIGNGVLNEENPNKSVSQVIFKRPGDPISFDGPVLKRIKTTEEGRPLREIHSVIMTTSGFLSTAREGKLPEARTPHQERSESPQPPTYPMVPPEVKVEKKIKKIPKKSNLTTEEGKPDKENKKKKIPKDTLFKPDEVKEVKAKKLTANKEPSKLKALKSGNKTGNPNMAGPSNVATGKVQGKMLAGSPKHAKNTVLFNNVKSEKVDVQNMENPLLNERKEETIDKLPSEPDKQKLNIFKKISSKPKEDREKELLEPQHKLKDLEISENSSSLIVDEKEKNRNNIVVKQEDKKPILQNSLVNNNVIQQVPVTDNNIMHLMSPGSDVYMFDNMSPSRIPSTPKTPEISIPNVVVEQKKKRKEKTGKKKEPKPKNSKNIINSKKARLSSDSNEITILDRPKTPQAPEHPIVRDPNLPSTLPFPFFPPFPAAPGLIPHPMFPLPMHKGIPGIVGSANPGAVMPGMLRPRFFRPKLDPNKLLVPPSFIDEPLQSAAPVFPLKQPQLPQMNVEKPKMTKSPDKDLLSTKLAAPPFVVPDALVQSSMLNNIRLQAPNLTQILPPAVPAPLLPVNASLVNKSIKSEKPEKADKKSKEHKKEKKDKLKKKKEKKEKHKDKSEKVKEKKEKSEKKEKLEKLKEKKEKKEKRKEKEASKKVTKEEKAVESVPKITLKLGPAGGSPRPPTPDSALMKKITIKPPKKPEDEVKREPTPELARISALVTRPPKQKTTSKKAEEGLLETYAALPSATSFSSSTLTSNSRVKKSAFKVSSRREPSPNPSLYHSLAIHSLEPQENTNFCFTAKGEAVPKKEDTKEDKENGGNALTSKSSITVDQSGRQVWICPACGKQDDGSPMIGCDDCDAWYHWVCVGIQVAPADNEDWYCRLCIAKKQELYNNDKKKKKRKKKVKVNA